jgi:hypothetical protein
MAEKTIQNARLEPVKLGVAAGVILAIWLALATLASMLNIPGFASFTSLLTDMYGPYGYSVSGFGLFVILIYGFIEAFIPIWLLALVYNKLLR